jgi:hypothetical protein
MGRICKKSGEGKWRGRKKWEGEGERAVQAIWNERARENAIDKADR